MKKHEKKKKKSCRLPPHAHHPPFFFFSGSLRAIRSFFAEGPFGEPSVDTEGSSCTHYVHVSGGTGITPLQVVTNQLISEAKRGRAIDCLWWGAAACARRVPHLSALLCSSAAQTGALEPVGWHAAGAARRCLALLPVPLGAAPAPSGSRGRCATRLW